MSRRHRIRKLMSLQSFAQTSGSAQDLAHGLEQLRINELRIILNDESETPERRSRAKTALADMGIK